MSRDFWDKNAESWGRSIRSNLIESRKVTNPAIIGEILRRKPGSVLDLGCGEGWISSELLPRGIRYMGLDFSSRLIDAARHSHPGASFETLSYDDLVSGAWKTPAEFDVVVCNFSLCESDLRPILRGASSFAKVATGTILIQTLHPCSLSSPYEDGWRTEDFKSFPVPFEGAMKWYARTFGSWIRTFSESGLNIESVLEPLDPASGAPLSVIFALRAKA
jgi:SAM-dependent methyltransferase